MFLFASIHFYLLLTAVFFLFFLILSIFLSFIFNLWKAACTRLHWTTCIEHHALRSALIIILIVQVCIHRCCFNTLITCVHIILIFHFVGTPRAIKSNFMAAQYAFYWRVNRHIGHCYFSKNAGIYRFRLHRTQCAIEFYLRS